MYQKIDFNGKQTHSVGRNGDFNTTAVSLFRIHNPEMTPNPEDGYIQLRGVTTKGQEASGYIAIPRDENTLRDLAKYFADEADKVAGECESRFLKKLAG